MKPRVLILEQALVARGSLMVPSRRDASISTCWRAKKRKKKLWFFFSFLCVKSFSKIINREKEKRDFFNPPSLKTLSRLQEWRLRLVSMLVIPAVRLGLPEPVV